MVGAADMAAAEADVVVEGEVEDGEVVGDHWVRRSRCVNEFSRGSTYFSFRKRLEAREYRAVVQQKHCITSPVAAFGIMLAVVNQDMYAFTLMPSI